MKKTIFTIIALVCAVVAAQAEEMWHIVGTNTYTYKQCLSRIQIVTDSLTGIDFYFRHIPGQTDAAGMADLYERVFDRLTQSGAMMPTGDPDILNFDEGMTGFYRSMWTLNEYPADGGWWIWNDAGVSDMLRCTWDNTNPIIQGAYMRLMYNLMLQNTYLHLADSLNVYPAERAQVRFVRALTAWYLLDLFSSSHFTTATRFDINATMGRQQLYTWLETELLSLTTLLPATRSDIYHVNVDAARLLLARLYLNAGVYTGTPQWANARQYAELVINHATHPLHTTSTGGIYTPYQELFMGDNDQNGAAEEAILLLKQDGQTRYGWAGSLFTICATRYNNMPPYCISGQWYCWRAGYRLLQAFANDDQLDTLRGTEFTMPAALGDDRAMFFADNTYPVPSMSEGWYDFNTTWSVNKFTARYSTDPMDGSACSNSSPNWPDTDLPLMRSAEAYLTAAEACYRLGDLQNAYQYIVPLRSRAHASMPANVDADFLLQEWLREFHGEGRRRVDLVRFGQFASPSATYTWEGHQNVTDATRNTFPTPDLLTAFPRLDNKVRYYAWMVNVHEADSVGWENGIPCDSCNTGEVYTDRETYTSYVINNGDMLGFYNQSYAVEADAPLEIELAEFPYSVAEDFDLELPAASVPEGAFAILFHSDVNYGNDLVVQGDYLNAAGEWIYSQYYCQPVNHATSGTNVKNQSFARFDSIGNGWYKAVVYPIAEKDPSVGAVYPGIARITGIANYPVGSTDSPQPVLYIHKVEGIVDSYMENWNTEGDFQFTFSQLAYEEDTVRRYYTIKNTDRIAYLAAGAVPQGVVPVIMPDEGRITMVIQIPEGSECNGIALKGTYDGSLWTGANEYLGENGITDAANCIRFQPIAGWDNWYQASFPIMDGYYGLQGKICLIYTDDSMWQGQAVDWAVESRYTTADTYTNYGGNIEVFSEGVIYVNIGGWQRSECNLPPLLEYNLTVVVPDFCNGEFDMEVVGGFEGWGTNPVALTAVSGSPNTYTATIIGREGDEWKVRGAGSWDKEILMYYSDVEAWYGVPNNSLPQGTGVVVDYSNSYLYRWNECSED